jgi:hypothetical protein
VQPDEANDERDREDGQRRSDRCGVQARRSGGARGAHDLKCTVRKKTPATIVAGVLVTVSGD